MGPTCPLKPRSNPPPRLVIWLHVCLASCRSLFFPFLLLSRAELRVCETFSLSKLGSTTEGGATHPSWSYHC